MSVDLSAEATSLAGVPLAVGLLYEAVGTRLYALVGEDSVKARNVRQNPRVAVSVPVPAGRFGWMRARVALWRVGAAVTFAGDVGKIDERAQGNNMLAHLDQWQVRDGRIGASRAWRPTCARRSRRARASIGRRASSRNSGCRCCVA